MTKYNPTRSYLPAIVITLLTSCGIPKDLQQLADSKPKELVELPVEYANLFPSLSFDRWDKDYDLFDSYLTQDVMLTQMGLSYNHKGVETWWCAPCVQTHVQIDTATMINDNNNLIGNWRIACNRTITYTDSALYSEKKIYRSSKVMYDNKDDDALLSLTSNKFNLYAKKKGKDSFNKVTIKNYHIENKRFLMLYGHSKAGAAVSFIGIDNEGRLIINTFNIQERKIKNVYQVYEATMSQLVFKKMTP